MATAETTSVRAERRLSPLESYLHVLHALMLRDMRTRFGGTLWGYAVVVLWPCAHVFMLITIFTFQHLPVPIGNSAPLFFATGAVPGLIFQYISREVMKATLVNRPLTYYPQVKLFDLIFARVLVEIVTGFLGLLVIMSVLTAIGTNVRPTDSFVAVQAYLASILLGIGIGIVNVAIVGFFPGWLMGYALFSIIMYILSGVMLMPSFFPENVYYWFRFNPALQLSEWMRTAYYPSIGLKVDYFYVIMFSLTCMSIGLAILKFVVSKRSG